MLINQVIDNLVKIQKTMITLYVKKKISKILFTHNKSNNSHKLYKVMDSFIHKVVVKLFKKHKQVKKLAIK
jgi:hypothetical protein